MRMAVKILLITVFRYASTAIQKLECTTLIIQRAQNILKKNSSKGETYSTTRWKMVLCRKNLLVKKLQSILNLFWLF